MTDRRRIGRRPPTPLNLDEAALCRAFRRRAPTKIPKELARIDPQATRQFEHGVQARNVVPQLKLADLASVDGTAVTKLFLSESALLTRCQQFLAEGFGDFIGQFAHSVIVAITKQGVYSKDQGGYFRYPVYTPPAFHYWRTKRKSSQRSQTKEELVTKIKEDPDVHNRLVALHHQFRRQIMNVFVNSTVPLSPMEVAAELCLPLSNISYHVRVLDDCEAITLVRTKPVRGSLQHFYRPDEAFIGLSWVRSALGIDAAANKA